MPDYPEADARAHDADLGRLLHDTMCKVLGPDSIEALQFQSVGWEIIARRRADPIRKRLHSAGQLIYDRAGVEMAFFNELVDDLTPDGRAA